MANLSQQFFARLSIMKFAWIFATISFTSACNSGGLGSNANSVFSGTLDLAPGRALADGNTTVQATITLKNTLNISLEGLVIQLEADASTVDVQQPTATDKNGVAVGTLTSDTAVTTNIHAYVLLGENDKRLIASAPIEFYTSQAKIALSVDPASAVADGNSSLTVVARVTDANGNAWAGQSVTFSSSNPQDVWDANGIETGTDGQAITTLVSTHAGARTIQASTTGIVSNTVASTFIAGAFDLAHSLISVNPNRISATGVSLSTVAITTNDQYDNPIAGLLVALSSSESTDVITPQDANTNASGVATFSASGTTAGSHTLTALIDGQTLTSTLELVTANPNATYSSLTTDHSTACRSPNPTPNPDTITATFTLMDDLNQPIPNQTVTCTTDGSSNTITTPAATDANGVTSCSYTSTVAQSEKIIVSIGSVSLQVDASFNGCAMSAFLMHEQENRYVLAQYQNTANVSDSYEHNNMMAKLPLGASRGAISTAINKVPRINSVHGTRDAPVLGRMRTVTYSSSGLSTHSWFPNQDQTNPIFRDDYIGLASKSKPYGRTPNKPLDFVVTKQDAAGHLSIAIADMTGDGALDLVMANESEDTLNVASMTHFSAPNILSQIKIDSPAFVQVADLNNDGVLDAVAVSRNAHALTVLLGTGDGTLSVSKTHNLPEDLLATSLALSHLDGDGYADIAVVGQGTQFVHLFYNSVNGALTQADPLPAGSHASEIAIADIDLDGHNDIAVLNQEDAEMTVWKGGKNQSLVNGFSAIVCDGTRPGNMIVADLNHDGYSDFVVACPSKSLIEIFTNTKQGSFESATIQTESRMPDFVTVSDTFSENKVGLLYKDAASSDVVWVHGNEWQFQSPLDIGATDDIKGIQVTKFADNG